MVEVHLISFTDIPHDLTKIFRLEYTVLNDLKQSRQIVTNKTFKDALVSQRLSTYAFVSIYCSLFGLIGRNYSD